jgi:ribosome-associated protein
VQISEQNTAATATPLPSATPLLKLILSSLDDDKGEEIVTLDLRGKTSIADYMVVANGRSNRQVSAMAGHLLSKLKDAGYGNCQVEGLSQGDWVLIDAGDVIVHIFRPEVRSFYNLEKMWSMNVTGDNSVN